MVVDTKENLGTKANDKRRPTQEGKGVLSPLCGFLVCPLMAHGLCGEVIERSSKIDMNEMKESSDVLIIHL